MPPWPTTSGAHLEDLGDGVSAARSQSVVPHNNLMVLDVPREVRDRDHTQLVAEFGVRHPPRQIHTFRVVIYRNNEKG